MQPVAFPHDSLSCSNCKWLEATRQCDIALMHSRSRTMRWRSLTTGCGQWLWEEYFWLCCQDPCPETVGTEFRCAWEDDCPLHAGATRAYLLSCARTTPPPTSLRAPQHLSSSSMRLQNLSHRVSNGPRVLTWNVCRNGQAVSSHTSCGMMMVDGGRGGLPGIMVLGQLSLR